MAVSDIELPLLLDGQTQPTNDGGVVMGKFKIILLECLPGLHIEIRIGEEDWDDFIEILTEQPVIKLATAADVAAITLQ